MENDRFFFENGPESPIVRVRHGNTNGPSDMVFAEIISAADLPVGKALTFREILQGISDRFGDELDIEFFPDGDTESEFVVHIGEDGDHFHFWRLSEAPSYRACAYVNGSDYPDISWLEAVRILLERVNRLLLLYEYWRDMDARTAAEMRDCGCD